MYLTKSKINPTHFTIIEDKRLNQSQLVIKSHPLKFYIQKEEEEYMVMYVQEFFQLVIPVMSYTRNKNKKKLKN